MTWSRAATRGSRTAPRSARAGSRRRSPAERLAFWWSADGEPASRVELTLEPATEGDTRLHVIEARPLEVLDVAGIPLPGGGGAPYGPSMVALA